MYKNIQILFFVIIFVSSCSKQIERESVDKQNTAIENYLISGGYNYNDLGGVFRVVFPNKAPTGVTLERGDSLYFYFVQSIFTTVPGKIYYTNILDVAIEEKMDITNMNFEPFGIEYGTTKLIGGYEVGFEGAMLGDTLALFMTSDMAYGNKPMAVIPKNQSISSVVIIEKIVK